MKKINIMVGRFQPITKGHIRCVDMAYKETGNPTILCMIDTPEDKVDKRHPFPSSLLIPLYQELFNHHPRIEGIIPVKNADIIAIGELLRGRGYIMDSWTCGTDRFQSYQAMVNRYRDRIYATDGFRLIEVRRTEDDVSATRLREALLNDDRKEFYKLFPKIGLSSATRFDFYDILRKQIIKLL